MYQQAQQIEKYHLSTVPKELDRELLAIRRVRLVENTPGYNSLMNRILSGFGTRLIAIGSRLTERYGNLIEADCSPDTAKSQAAGLV